MNGAIRTHGAPRQVISNNGLSTGRRHKREVLSEKSLKALGIQPKNACKVSHVVHTSR
jgi:hypothetical protein